MMQNDNHASQASESSLDEQLYHLVKERQTPCYIYETDKIRRNFQALRETIPSRFKILYSLKANPHPAIISELKTLGSSFDVASYNELQTVLNAGVNPAEISFVGPGKTEEEIRFAIRENVATLVIESTDQLELVDLCASEAGKIQNISFRISPKEYFDLKGRMRAGRPTQFGIDEEDLANVFAVLSTKRSVRFVGIHTHVQSQILEADNIVKNFRIAERLFNEIKRNYAPGIDLINFGGGFGIPYTEKDQSLDMGALKLGLAEFERLDSSLRPYVETGRYVVGQSGRFIVKVMYRKESRGEKILVVDGGMNNNFSIVGANQFERRNYMVRALTNRPAENHQKYTIVGPSCYFMDVLATDLVLPEMRPGDYIAFENSGCYGVTFSPNQFLGQKRAQEYFVSSVELASQSTYDAASERLQAPVQAMKPALSLSFTSDVLHGH